MEEKEENKCRLCCISFAIDIQFDSSLPPSDIILHHTCACFVYENYSRLAYCIKHVKRVPVSDTEINSVSLSFILKV